MKFDELAEPPPLDLVDRQILGVLQDDCKTPLARIGQLVGLSAPSVVERLRKLEGAGVIRGYHAVVSARHLGLDVTAFIGVSINYPKMIGTFEQVVASVPDVLECHHVTGDHTLLLKVKTRNTATLEQILSRIRSTPGVERTHTMIVLSTQAERTQIVVELPERQPGNGKAQRARRSRRREEQAPAPNGPAPRVHDDDVEGRASTHPTHARWEAD